MDKLRKELALAYDQTFSYNKEGDPESFINILHKIFKEILDSEGLFLFDSLSIERGSIPVDKILASSSKSADLEESKNRKIKSLHQTNVRNDNVNLMMHRIYTQQ